MRKEADPRRVIVCACHDVTLHDLQRSYASGYRHPETLKRATAAFMGPCQGKHCARLIVDVIAELAGAGEPEGAQSRPTARPPLYPVRLGELACAEDGEVQA